MADRAKFLDFLDMIDGGGAGKMGGEFEGGGIFSQLANLVATPYGSEDERRKKMRMEFYLDKLGTPEEQAKAAAATAARNRPSVITKSTPAAPMLSSGPTTRGGQRGPRVAPAGADYPNMSMPSIAGYTSPPTAQMTKPSVLSGGTVQPMPSSSQDSNTGTAILTFGGGEMMPQPSMPNPAAFSANPPSAAAMTSATPAPADRNPRLAAFNAAMATVPQILQGTEIAGMYRDHLLNGGGGTFAQFTGGM